MNRKTQRLLRNPRLTALREQLGMGQAEIARAAKVHFKTYCDLECARISPFTVDGSWRKPALALAAFHCVSPEELFLVDGPVDDGYIASEPVETPSEILTRLEMSEEIYRAVDKLPHRMRVVIRQRYGLSGRTRTLKAIGKTIGVTKEQVRQIQLCAIYKLRHPATAKSLRIFW